MARPRVLSEDELPLHEVPLPSNDWRLRAACLRVDLGGQALVDHVDAYFPGRTGRIPPEVAAALDLCRNVCPVREECRDFAMNWPTLRGIWGGLREEERKAWRRRGWRPAA